MKNNRVALMSLIMLGLLTVSAHSFGAEESSDRGQRVLENLDTDGDGVVSLEEYEPREARMMGSLDSNQDGILTLDEFLSGTANMNPGNGREISEERKARMEEMRTQRFMQMDIDDDGSVTMAEIKQSTFAAIDADSNGSLSATELNQAQRMRRGGGRRGGIRGNGQPPQ